jgi:hypothetical protein
MFSSLITVFGSNQPGYFMAHPYRVDVCSGKKLRSFASALAEITVAKADVGFDLQLIENIALGNVDLDDSDDSTSDDSDDDSSDDESETSSASSTQEDSTNTHKPRRLIEELN